MFGRIVQFTTGSALALFLSFTPAGATPAVSHPHARAHSNANSHTAVVAPVVALDIVRDPADVPPPIGDRAPMTVRQTLTAREVVGKLDPESGSTYSYWTFDGTVPGPMLRVREGDTVEITIRNESGSHMPHSIDLHAAIGSGGGAMLTQTLPGESNTFTFVATRPGLFVYHCGTPIVAQHIANGMYGLILVEPAGGLPRADREFYVMQGEIYTASELGTAGEQKFALKKMLDEKPEYFVFNGAVDALTKEYPLKARTGDTVRIFFGNAGPNLTSSPHIMGEIFSKVYQFGSLTTAPLTDVQTASVPPGGAAVMEFKASMPGEFGLVDHAITRMLKGLMAHVEVSGEAAMQLMHDGAATTANESSAMPANAAETVPAAATPSHHQ